MDKMDKTDKRGNAPASVTSGASVPDHPAPAMPDRPGVVITRLAELPADSFLDTEALGGILGRCKKTIQRAVRRGELPPPIIFLGRHVWIVRTILAHMEARQAAAVKIAEGRALRISRNSP